MIRDGTRSIYKVLPKSCFLQLMKFYSGGLSEGVTSFSLVGELSESLQHVFFHKYPKPPDGVHQIFPGSFIFYLTLPRHQSCIIES